MISSIEELPIEGKRVFLRVDFNVPLTEENGVIKVADDTRIREALLTIQHVIKRGARLVLGSHLGRPQGKDPKFSLEPIANHLSQLLNQDVFLTDDCVGDGVVMIIRHLKTSSVTLLENLRFHPEEEQNNPEFCEALSQLADIYVNDAFGTAHRKHASTYGVARLMPVKGYGFLIQKELQFLTKLLNHPEHPYIAILGGSKVSDKIKTIENLFTKVDVMLIGGAMAHAFKVAKGESLSPQAKQPKLEDIEHAKHILEKARKQEIKLLLPVDDIDSFDIGPKTIEAFCKELSPAKTIFWNGPLGMFEKEQYSKGTFALAQALAPIKAFKVVGGGDTALALQKVNVTQYIDHVSTGGGATLEFLEGNSLPGIDILKTSKSSSQKEKK